MGLRFRKSFKAGPFRVNISKKGVGWSAGVKGARYTKRTDGRTQKTLSIPGTGISHVTTSSSKKTKGNSNNGNINWLKILLILLFLPLAMIYYGYKYIWNLENLSQKTKIIILSILTILLFTVGMLGNSWWKKQTMLWFISYLGVVFWKKCFNSRIR